MRRDDVPALECLFPIGAMCVVPFRPQPGRASVPQGIPVSEQDRPPRMPLNRAGPQIVVNGPRRIRATMHLHGSLRNGTQAQFWLMSGDLSKIRAIAMGKRNA